MKKTLSVILFVIFTCWMTNTEAGPLDETRICGEPGRNASGQIVRSSSVLTAFKKVHPCPATGLSTGSCPGWSIDHVLPLACGGCDEVTNLQWLPNRLKTCAGDCKDRWERKINCKPMQTVVMP